MNTKVKKSNVTLEALCSLYRFNHKNGKPTSTDIQNAIGLLEYSLIHSNKDLVRLIDSPLLMDEFSLIIGDLASFVLTMVQTLKRL